MAEDFELTLYDRLEAIRAVLQDIGPDRAYVSFSGGADSTVLHYLIDEAIPHNEYPRVFSNTGVEYQAIVEFVKSLAEKDSRFQIIAPGKNVRLMLKEKGYPFKSKVHSDIVRTYQNSGFETKTVQKYADAETTARGRFHCPKCLRYQFTPDFNIPISAHCCRGLKKEPFRKFEQETGRTLGITGVRAAEGGPREYQALGGCIFRDKNGGIHRFAPLSPVSDEFMAWYIETRHIQLCSLYYPPYSFKRTGCKGCPYNVKIRDTLDTMQKLLPAEWKQCWSLWGPIYKEYKRIGYRKMKGVPEPE